MILTRKQRAVLKLSREGFTPSQIAKETGMHRVSVAQLLERAKKRLRAAGLSPEKVLEADKGELLELIL